mmetsp:Transcript_33107/g.72342  ORF Transcript_33107/g.72342 Transcript_33107/m.72342 type:complete len:215 (-) Transcript_33107:254-898(-)
MPRLPASTAWRIWTRLLTLPARTPALSQMRLRPTRRISRLRMRTLRRWRTRLMLRMWLGTQAWTTPMTWTLGMRETTTAMIPPFSRARTPIRTRTLTRTTLRMGTWRATWTRIWTVGMTTTMRTRRSCRRRAMMTTLATTKAWTMMPVTSSLMIPIWETMRMRIWMMTTPFSRETMTWMMMFPWRRMMTRMHFFRRVTGPTTTWMATRTPMTPR